MATGDSRLFDRAMEAARATVAKAEEDAFLAGFEAGCRFTPSSPLSAIRIGRMEWENYAERESE